MPGLTFSNELISRDEGTHTVSTVERLFPGLFKIALTLSNFKRTLRVL